MLINVEVENSNEKKKLPHRFDRWTMDYNRRVLISYAKGGRPLKYSKRELLNAVLYVLRTGVQWRNLPHDFPNWKSVYYQFTKWKRQKVFEKMNHELIELIRKKSKPSVAIIDSQSVKKTEVRGIGGYDPVKKNQWPQEAYPS